MSKNKKRKDGNTNNKLYYKIEGKYDILPEEVLREMQATIDAARNNPAPGIREQQRRLFPNRKPSIEEFIKTIAEQIERT